MRRARAGPGADPCRLFVDLFLAFFATWTLYCNLLVYTRQSFDSLARFSLLPILAGLGVALALPRLERFQVAPASAPPTPSPLRSPFPTALALAVLAVASFAILRSYALLWLLSLAALGATLALIALPAKSQTTPQRALDRVDERRHRTRDWVFPLSLTIAAALITLLAHRPDADDSLYLNVIVTSLDFPGEPLLLKDGLHGIPQLPLAYVVYRAHSFELLNAILARFSGLSPLAIYYLLLPPVFAALVIAGQWTLLRRLNPSLALPALGVTFAVMLLWGDTHWSPGNFAFVRLHQGKAIFASAMVPIILFYALRFSERGDARSWTGLFLAQVAAVGLSSSAVFVAPATAGLALIAGWQRDAARAPGGSSSEREPPFTRSS
jgi:hypothetical protein